MPAVVATAHNLDPVCVCLAIRMLAVVASEPVFKKMLISEQGRFRLVFRELILIPLGEREAEAFVGYLPDNGFINFFLSIAQDNGPIAAEEVDIFIPVNVR